jgi:hypothetical protein
MHRKQHVGLTFGTGEAPDAVSKPSRRTVLKIARRMSNRFCSNSFLGASLSLDRAISACQRLPRGDQFQAVSVAQESALADRTSD